MSGELKEILIAKCVCFTVSIYTVMMTLISTPLLSCLFTLFIISIAAALPQWALPAQPDVLVIMYLAHISQSRAK